MQETILMTEDRTRTERIIRNLIQMSKKKANRNPMALLSFIANYAPYFTRDLHGSERELSPSYVSKDIFEGKTLENFLLLESKEIDFLKREIGEISGVVDFKTQLESGKVDFLVFLEQPDWKIEEKIYAVYSKFLHDFPEDYVDLQVIELFGKKPPAPTE